MRQTQLTNPQEGLALAPTGWHPVKASFEVDKVTCNVLTEYLRFPMFRMPINGEYDSATVDLQTSVDRRYQRFC